MHVYPGLTPPLSMTTAIRVLMLRMMPVTTMVLLLMPRMLLTTMQATARKHYCLHNVKADAKLAEVLVWAIWGEARRAVTDAVMLVIVVVAAIIPIIGLVGIGAP